MPKITELTKQKRNKDRYNIYIDGQYHCSLNVDEIAINTICVGKEIDINELNDIIEADNLKFGFNLAIKYLSIKRRTISETNKYLISKDIDQDIAYRAIQKVLDYNYLDDNLYAKDFVSYKINEAKFGKSTIKYKLKQKGIADDIIEDALQDFDYETEFKICKKTYDKLLKRCEKLDPQKAKQKIYRSLASKGFSFDIIGSVINSEDE